ncbi:unnamed protein product [Musa hybrid cultivar]
MWFACLRTLEGKLILVWPVEDDIQSNQQRYDTAGEEVMLRSRTQVTLKHQVMELQATFHRIESGNILMSTR